VSIAYPSPDHLLLKINFQLSASVLVRPGDRVALGPPCHECAAKDLADQSSAGVLLPDRQEHDDAWTDDCPATCETFPEEYCGAWANEELRPALAQSNPKYYMEYDDKGNGGLGEALDIVPFEWALRNGATFYWKSWMKPYWCGYDNSTRTARAPPRNWRKIMLNTKPKATRGHKVRFRRNPPADRDIQQLYQINGGITHGMHKIVFNGKEASLYQKCAFFAFTCPSKRVALPLQGLLSHLPERFAGIHFRSVGQKSKAMEFGFVRALAPEIPPPSASAQALTWLDHVHHIDKELTRRCYEMDQDLWKDTEQGACHCPTRIESLIQRAVNFTGTDDESRVFPMFFATDLISVSTYVRRFMRKWLIQSEGDPFHYVNQANQYDKAKESNESWFPSNDRSKANQLDSMARVFVDLQAFSLAEWTVGTRKTSHFSYKPARMGFGSYTELGDDCMTPVWSLPQLDKAQLKRKRREDREKRRKEKEKAADTKAEPKEEKAPKSEKDATEKEKEKKQRRKEKAKAIAKEASLLKSVLPKRVEVKGLSKEDALKLAVQRAKGKIQIRTIPRGKIGRGKIVFPGKVPGLQPPVGE
jgi:hypothetical protein